MQAAEALKEDGASHVIVAATHGVLSEPAAERLKNSCISEVIVTNTLPIPDDKRFPKLTVLSIAPLIARADPRGLRRRLGHLPVRRQRLTA